MNSELIDEQTAARVLSRREEIVTGALTIDGGRITPADEEAAVHLAGVHMAEEIRDYFEVITEKFSKEGLNGADTIARLRDFAQQFEAHHLHQLDRLSPA